ncbi:hypothetical protein GCM10010840_23490 [Deinococcus aerolatus]|uniref:Peripheral subunit-binding (PSBD) domain-containing protein n=1 Tax=Deinococcus aerolatus TaxID=522487 RepID=A0ABQ2GBK0_9DEIO|nr:E3 binding domain-containing protein [Deinococcus aerolatus]GGL84893.1 hypothetical protein GCM10010840_23490 [Deinococcus aerolatus]
MEQIAPLAKILAEANGIEWQQLRGSGAGGTIVEQDILNYLSRIMSGEEEPPSTPVDEMPEGWTGDEQLPAGMFSAAQLSEAGIDSDIADFVTQVRSPEVPATPAAPSLSHDAMDFELDDEMDHLDAPLAAEPQPIATNWSFAPAQAQAEQPPYQPPYQPSAPAPEPAFPSLSAPEPVAAPEVHVPDVQVPDVHVPAASAPAETAAGGLSGLLSRLYRKDKEPEAAPPAPIPDLQPAAPTLGQHDLTFASTHQPPQPDLQPVAVSAPAVELDAPATDAPEMDTPDVAAAEVDLQAPAVDAPVIEAPAIEVPALEAPVAELPASEQVYAAELAEPELLAPEPQASESQAPALEAPEVKAAVVPGSVAASPAMPAAAVWFGTYLRRDARMGAAQELCAQLSEALDQNVSLAFLVARAARHHADALGLDLGSVALYGADGQDQPITGAALREALKAPHAAQDSAPDLLVTDAGALDVDELHFPHTLTLSVGRVQDGRSALSLNGDVDPTQGAQFLARVAGALEKPIALVL